jgi:hypothetical protein
MSDEGLNRYARDLAAEVDEAGAVYSEEEFTRLVLDKLGDEGVLDNPIPLYQEGSFARTRYKITAIRSRIRKTGFFWSPLCIPTLSRPAS